MTGLSRDSFDTRYSFDRDTPADQWPTFKAWCDAQTHFMRWDRDTDADAMIVVPYTYCPNVADLLDESNHAAIISALEEASPDGVDYAVRSHGHWATPYEMILVRDGSAAYEAMDQCMAALADYPVLDESDFSEREHEATLENIESELRSFSIERDGNEVDVSELACELFSWFWDNDQGAVECTDGGGGYPSHEELRDGLAGLGYCECEDDIWRPETECADPTE